VKWILGLCKKRDENKNDNQGVHHQISEYEYRCKRIGNKKKQKMKIKNKACQPRAGNKVGFALFALLPDRWVLILSGFLI